MASAKRPKLVSLHNVPMSRLAGGQIPIDLMRGRHGAETLDMAGNELPSDINSRRRQLITHDEFRVSIRADAINYITARMSKNITRNDCRFILGVHATGDRIEEQNWRTWRPFTVEPVSGQYVNKLANEGGIIKTGDNSYDLESVIEYAIHNTPNRKRKPRRKRKPSRVSVKTPRTASPSHSLAR